METMSASALLLVGVRAIEKKDNLIPATTTILGGNDKYRLGLRIGWNLRALLKRRGGESSAVTPA